MKPSLWVWIAVSLGWCQYVSGQDIWGQDGAAAEARRPNVVVIVSDDAGWADFSMHGAEHFPTPRIDSIAANGVRFAQGYVTASVCSPSRAGLLTGRYQQRFGHERNIPPRYSETNGLPRSERTLADHLEDAGYRTVALGKWHLGYAPHFHPQSRGFQDYFGFLQGARSYGALAQPTRLNRLLRDRTVVAESFDYMTDALGEEAAAYVERHKDVPFFLYLAFNAVHTPMHARESDLAAITGEDKPRRQKLKAMTIALDRGVGKVLDALDAHGLTRDTLVVFVNDNGGATNNGSSNGPLRGTKGTPFEGGLRVPFAMQWPGRLPAGVVYEHPVSTLDILPTALAAAGLPAVAGADGVALIPFLRGEVDGRPHPVLFWRQGESFAVRRGDLKLMSHKGGPRMLFDLAGDPGESDDLAAARPDDVASLQAQWDAWARDLAAPRW